MNRNNKTNETENDIWIRSWYFWHRCWGVEWNKFVEYNWVAEECREKVDRRAGEKQVGREWVEECRWEVDKQAAGESRQVGAGVEPEQVGAVGAEQVGVGVEPEQVGAGVEPEQVGAVGAVRVVPVQVELHK